LIRALLIETGSPTVNLPLRRHPTTPSQRIRTGSSLGRRERDVETAAGGYIYDGVGKVEKFIRFLLARANAEKEG